MQALTGFERAVGGKGNDPIAAHVDPYRHVRRAGWRPWGSWPASTDAADRGRYRVVTSLLGAGMLLQSGTFQRDGVEATGPGLDAASDRLWARLPHLRCGDGHWVAMVIPDPAGWARLRSLPAFGSLPARYAPLRSEHDGTAIAAEAVLEEAFRHRAAHHWVEVLRRPRIACRAGRLVDRDQFRRAILDDPVNRQLGRVASYPTAEWGRFEQIGPLMRFGPERTTVARLMLPGMASTLCRIGDLGITKRRSTA